MKTLSLVDSALEHDLEIPYADYGFEIFQVFDGEKETDFKAIYNKRTGKYIYFPRLGYKLLPNEVVLEASNGVADDIGLKPFKMITDATEDWRTFEAKTKKKGYVSKKVGRKLVQSVPNETHCLLDESATRMFAFYTMPKLQLDKNEDMNFGIVVRNSVDGTSGLSIDGFTFRHVCSNASLMTLMQVASAGREESVRKRHTKNLDITLGNLEFMVKKVVRQMGNIRKTYERWMVEELNKPVIKKLGQNMPAKYLPDYISVEGRKAELTVSPAPTMWKTYNDLTASIWHGMAAIQTKQSLFVELHDAFGLGRK